MQVAKWGNSLAVRLPAAVVAALDLKEGDEVEINVVAGRVFEIDRDSARARAIETIKSLQRPLPAGWKFDRDQANAR